MQRNRLKLVLDSSGVDPGGGAKGAIAPPPIKIYLGESIFSPPQSFS